MKQKINNLISKIKTTESRSIGIVILGILVLIFLVFTSIYLLSAKNVSSIEKQEIKTNSKELINYIEDITDTESKEIDRYIIFALDYSYNTNSLNTLTIDQIYDFLNDKFTLKITKEDLEHIGITPVMLNRDITYDSTKKAYTLNIVKKNTNNIMETPIIYYKLDKLSRANKRKYIAVYRQYIIENPYDVLNYYLEKNMNIGSDEQDKLVDVTPIRNYLMGNAKVSSVKDIINDEDISKYGKKGKKIKITYIYKDNNIRIDKIK